MVKVKKDLTGLKFGTLLVLSQTDDYVRPDGRREARWLCQCDCGNTTSVIGACLKQGSVKSCGCKKYIGFEKRNNTQKQKTDEKVIGQTFGDLTILKREYTKSSKIYYRCKCKCGNEVVFERLKLLKGLYKNCGCKKEINYNTIVDMTGKRYGKLVALYPTKKNAYGGIQWMFQCDCGNRKEIDGYTVRRGGSMSCGCLKMSHGEYQISYLLEQADIPFEKEKHFFNYNNDKNRKARFDFYVDNKYLIEFDGEQHYRTNNSWWNTSELVESYKERDKLKNQWCIENNVPLIRIPYSHLPDLKLEDLLLETTHFLINKEIKENNMINNDIYVAPTYKDLKKIGEVYQENKKRYINVQLKSGKLKKVRVYTKQEWNKAFLKPIVQQLSYNNLDEYFSSDVAKKARGFSEGPITILKTADEDWLSRTPQCYYGVDVGWYITSTNTMPDEVPDDLTCSQMTWEEFKELKLCHQ